jgi:hypothetical protein
MTLLTFSNVLMLSAFAVLLSSLYIGFHFESSLPIAFLVLIHVMPMLATLSIKLAYILRLKALSKFE